MPVAGAGALRRGRPALPCRRSSGQLGSGRRTRPPTATLLALSFLRQDKAARISFRRIEAIVVFSANFLLACLVTAPSFVVLGMSPVDALFEATSGITPTGLSVATDAESWPIAAHLLRGWLQWCGGFALAFAGLTILHDRGASTRALAASMLDERNELTTLRKQAFQLLAVYVGLTILAIAGCLILLPTWWEGVSVVLAAASTGGFTPKADSLASYGATAQVFVMFVCVVAAVSFLFYIRLWRKGPRGAFAGGHVGLLLGLLAGGTTLYAIAAALGFGPDDGALLAHALNFVSGFTTAGFSAGPIAAAPFMLMLLVVAMVIGGDTGSTAGGVKIGRIAVAIGMVRMTVMRTRQPTHGVLHLRDRGARQTTDDI